MVTSTALLGRYELVSELGHGGMAKVYRARVAGPGGFEKTLVVKCILPHLAQDPQFVEMFLSEARLAARLNHPNLVQIFDFGESEGAYFLAMEYIDGPTLRALLRRLHGQEQRVPYPLCARIASSVCEGLTFAHEFCDPDTGEAMRMVHRDVSPDNILLTRSGNVKLVDFGIAKATSQAPQTQVGTLKGKVPYMAPEQLRNEPLAPSSDVYSLGVVLYEMVAGAKPFEAANDAALMHAILYEPFIPLAARREDVPQPLQYIVQRALAKDRTKRYASCREMQADLDRYLLSCGHPVGTQQLAQLISRAAVPTGGSPVVGTPVSGNGSRPREQSRGSGSVRPGTGGSMPVPPTEPGPGSPSTDPTRPGTGGSMPVPPTEPGPGSPSTGPTRSGALKPGRRAVLVGAVGVVALLAGAVALGLRSGGGAAPPAPVVAAPPVAQPVGAPPKAPEAPSAATGTPAPVAAVTPAVVPAGPSVPAAGVAAASAEQAPPAPTEVELQVTVTPRKASLRLDDRPLSGNPFSDRFPRDGRAHVLRVSAPGYTTVVKEVRFDRDLSLDITLSRRGQESRRAAVVESPRREPEAQGREQEPDFAELPAKPARRKPPRRALDSDNPWSEQGGASPSETP
ncbi:serine/threonine protein kinase [Pyxidicoccus xibeiensis]|uniref:serine/threonine protein kinase n=1 Tax=Pyxidicoccus xibeiensis TaxID=2906759 RepID=UPI0020A82A2B|nr:serine/threonine-protein kinase [Pyxidicoccus xibeiensis]MCP3139673.1 protein kinase [Pyxidicoccus xibeiensis]